MKYAIIALLLTVSPSAAHQVLDGSDKNLPSDDIELVMSKISMTLLDPTKAQFRNLVETQNPETPRVYCGEVNRPNRFGGYDGFNPFFVDLTANDQAISDIKGDEERAFIYSLLKCPVPDGK